MTTQRLTRPASWKEFQERQQIFGPKLGESVQRGLAYQPQPSDVFISPFAKCGTTWVQQIVHGLRTRGDMNFDDVMRVMPWVEMAHWAGLDLNAPQPGGFQVFKSHLSWNSIPKGGRYIVPLRDPKDALVSFYNFLNGYWWETGSVSITEFAREHYLQYQDERWESSYWGHLVSWWEQRQNPHVLLLTYEWMKADLPGSVQTIADFLGIDLDADLFEIVVRQASLEFMRAHKSKFSDPIMLEASAKHGYLPGNDTITKVYNGRVGDHRSALPAEIGAEMDAIWQETVTPQTGLASYEDLGEAVAQTAG
jgi:hypothetical protein